MAKTKYVYYFGDGDAEGDESMRPILGGKGANLAQMAKKPLSLPVPSGFTISIDVCQEYYKLGKKYPAGLDAEWAKSSAMQKIRFLFQFAQALQNLCLV